MCICSSPDIHYKVNLKLFKEVAKEIDPVLNSLDFQKKSVRVCVCVFLIYLSLFFKKKKKNFLFCIRV